MARPFRAGGKSSRAPPDWSDGAGLNQRVEQFMLHSRTSVIYDDALTT
jgi:hypothetical protein